MLSPKHRKGKWVLFGTPEQLNPLAIFLGHYYGPASAIRIEDGKYVSWAELQSFQTMTDLHQFYSCHYPDWIHDNFIATSVEEYI